MCFGLLQEIIQECVTIFTEEYTVYKSFALREAKCTTHGWELLSFEEDIRFRMKGMQFQKGDLVNAAGYTSPWLQCPTICSMSCVCNDPSNKQSLN